MTTYIEPSDAQVLRKIGINVAALIAVAFLLMGIVSILT